MQQPQSISFQFYFLLMFCGKHNKMKLNNDVLQKLCHVRPHEVITDHLKISLMDTSTVRVAYPYFLSSSAVGRNSQTSKMSKQNL